MLSSKVTDTVLGRKKFVAVVALGVVGLAASYALATRSTAKVGLLTAAGDAWVLVKLEAAKTWSAADAYCTAAYGTHLAVIEDSAANQAMSDALTHYSVPAWIGFADLQNEGDFEWVDASPEAYANWDEGEPTDLCVQMLSATGTWKDVDCAESLKAFFCEAPAAMTATAAVRLDNFEVHSLDAAIGSGEAETYCQSQGAELYSVIDEADNERIATALRAAEVEFAFIGLETAPQSYAWMDGRALDFDMWATDEPKENQFSQMRASDGQWMTACAEATLLGVVCEQMNYAIAPPITESKTTTTTTPTTTTTTPTTTTTTPTTTTPPIGNHIVYANSVGSSIGASVTSQCLADNLVYDSSKIATAMRCVGGGQCFSGTNGNECYPMGVTYAQAFALCEADGRRLPTAAETAGICAGTGCSYDLFPLWTSGECQSSVEVPAAAVRSHYAYRQSPATHICLQDSESPSDGVETAVRCCEFDAGGHYSCDSGAPADCFGTAVTWTATQQKCASVGMDLCQVNEVPEKCTGTGCNYDELYVRTSTVCFNEGSSLLPTTTNHWAYANSPGSTSSVGASVKAQCLADNLEYDSRKIATAMRCVGGGQCFSGTNGYEDECYPMGVTYAEAFALCEADGRRLPTAEETAGICAGTGCSYDLFPIWTSGECQSSVEVPANAMRGHYAYKQSPAAHICLQDASTLSLADGLETAVRCCEFDAGGHYSCDSGSPDNCYGTAVTWAAAQQKCASLGKDLCQVNEVPVKCTGTGCSYDLLYVRSTTVCYGAEA